MEVDKPAHRRSARGKAAAPPADVARHPPRKLTYEILRAPPTLVAAFKAARTEYHDAVHAWWWRAPRAREDKPTAEDFARAKLDPWVRRAGRRLDEIDAQLTRLGEAVKNAAIKNDWQAPAKIRVEEQKCDRAYYDSLHNDAPSGTPQAHETRPTKRRRTDTSAPASSGSSSASRSSLPTLTPLTSPDPDPLPFGEKEAGSEHPSLAHKRWLKREEEL